MLSNYESLQKILTLHCCRLTGTEQFARLGSKMNGSVSSNLTGCGCVNRSDDSVHFTNILSASASLSRLQSPRCRRQ